ncbi:MAG: hypothetical protein JWO11_2145 [Nocardioides sp.]|nr:hypothetical protein [Nocardioides sp.]
MRLRTVIPWLLLLAVVLPALVLTGNRLLEPSAGQAVRVEAFTPLGLPLYAVALAGLVVAGVARRGRWRLLVVPTAVCLLGLGLHAWWWSPEVLGANPPPAEGAKPVVVMTANLFAGRGDALALLAEASDARVDILVVEEITGGVFADMERAGLDEVFPHRAGAPGIAVEGTMVFSREPMGAATRLDTNLESWEVTVGDLTILAVHPSAPTMPEAWRDDHAAILAAAREYTPDLVVGDLNATNDHAPLRALADAGWRDVAELANEGWQPTWPANDLFSTVGVPLPTLARIDHVLVGPALAAISSRTVALDGTDHRAVIAEVAPK